MHEKPALPRSLPCVESSARQSEPSVQFSAAITDIRGDVINAWLYSRV